MEVSLSIFHIILGVFVFFLGASIGSFLNVVSYRVPLGISICTPRSFCPACHIQIPVFSLVPVLGYFFTKGRCFSCKSRIPIQYPAVEFFTGLLTVSLFFWFFTNDFLEILFLQTSFATLSKKVLLEKITPFITSLWLLYTGISLSIIDIKHRILPDLIVLPGIVIGFFIACFNPEIGWFASMCGILVGGGGLFIISKLFEIIRKKEGMGMGDVKYLGFLGAVLGINGVFYTLIIASIIGSIYGIILGIIKKKGLAVVLPFGPFLALSAFLISVYR